MWRITDQCSSLTKDYVFIESGSYKWCLIGRGRRGCIIISNDGFFILWLVDTFDAETRSHSLKPQKRRQHRSAFLVSLCVWSPKAGKWPSLKTNCIKSSIIGYWVYCAAVLSIEVEFKWWTDGNSIVRKSESEVNSTLQTALIEAECSTRLEFGDTDGKSFICALQAFLHEWRDQNLWGNITECLYQRTTRTWLWPQVCHWLHQ